MRSSLALSFAAAILVVSGVASGVEAQEAIPETPPELRDFRLDPERAPAKPQPGPEPGVSVTAPSTAVSAAPELAPARPRVIAPRSEDEDVAVTPNAPTPPAVIKSEGSTEVAKSESIASSPPASVLPDDEPALALAPALEPEDDTSFFKAIGIVVGLLGVLLFGGYLFRRRRPLNPVRQQPSTRLPIEPEPAANIRSPKSALPKPIRAESAESAITIDFVPEKATVSFNTLTVRGQLRLVNGADVPALGMELRAGLISASTEQDNVIEAFHASPAVKPQLLGDAKVGDRVAMAIELSVPLGDMQSFTVGKQRLLVPILVASVSYRGSESGETNTVRFACMIGREAVPPVPKMGPLRLDLGPRSFASLGQRPIYE